MQEIINRIRNNTLVQEGEYFDLIQHITKSLNCESLKTNTEGRNMLIELLSQWDNISLSMKPIIADLVESVGFYPYLGKLNIDVKNLDAKIRKVYHQSKHLNNKILHSKQKELSEIVLSGKNVIVSAPTSFGKSLLIEEIIASRLYKNIVIIQPTLALLDETRIKLKNYENFYKLIVRTSQKFSESKGNIFLLTAERVLEYGNMPKIDLMILDEFYKLSNKRKDNRSNILNVAFLKLLKYHQCKFYLLGPNIDKISDGFEKKYNAVFFHTDYSMVYTETENKFNEVKKTKVDSEDLFKILDQLKEQTLVFCSSPSSARKRAFEYYAHLANEDKLINKELPLTTWIKENIAYNWSLTNCLLNQIAVHDGALPKHIATSIIHYFNAGKLKVLFCTNTIIEGVNTSAKNVILYDNKIGNRQIDYFDYANIKGRAGRLMEHYTGKIINLKEPPAAELFIVDIPFHEQDPIDDEVLMNLEKDDVKNINENMFKYAEFQKNPEKLKTILLRNNVSIAMQLEVLKILFDDLKNVSNKELIVWNKVDKLLYKRLKYIFDLCWDRFSTKGENSIGSKNWIICKTVDYCYYSSIPKILKEEITYRLNKIQGKQQIKTINDVQCLKNETDAQAVIDKTIEIVFKLQKNWFQYKIPKWINIVNSLQEYACETLGIGPGNYAYVADIIENEQIFENCRILLEYGIPKSAIEKLQTAIKNKFGDVTEDNVIEIIKRSRNSLSKVLSEYEMETINRSI